MSTDEKFTPIEKAKYLLQKGTIQQMKSVISHLNQLIFQVIEHLDLYMSDEKEQANTIIIPIIAQKLELMDEDYLGQCSKTFKLLVEK